MLDLRELEQFVSFAELGTLSRVAQTFHVSTPSVSRTMAHVEKAFGTSLFDRTKNRIELNETGRFAAEKAGSLLDAANQAVDQVRLFDERRKTIVIRSCAPAPLWEYQRVLSSEAPGKLVASAICDSGEVLSSWESGTCDVAILPFEFEGSSVFMKENLYVCVPKDHELAQHDSLRFADIDGFNFLLRTELGFWDSLCRKEMPASRFLVQSDQSEFDELVKASSLPCFITDYGRFSDGYPGRVDIPISDDSAHVSFYLARR